MTIVSNQVRCDLCLDTPFSAHRHDFRYCKCGNVAVDGGDSYLRRAYKTDQWEELSIEMDKDHIQKLIEAVKWADETGRNERGTVYAVLRAIRDCGLTISEKS